MEAATKPPRVVRFGPFEANFQARLLYTCGMRIKLQEKPFQVLQLLVERAGDLVGRLEVRERLWPDTHVRFDSSLNTAINTLRKALGDKAYCPRFIETRTGRGYRFIAKIETPGVEMLHVDRSGKAIASIAVLPFRSVSGDPEEENLSDTIAESILNRLSQLPQVGVVAWNTAIHYKTLQIDPQELGRNLNVHAILLGRVTQRADTLLVATELVDAQTGHRLWSEHYCGKHSGAAVQEEVSREISNKLSQWLTGLSGSRAFVSWLKD